jgi:preprotein translocase subunit YajC
VNIVALLPFIVLIGAMFLMTRSAKNKQRAAAQMRQEMVPGTGVRTIGGMYATVKEVNDDTIVVEIAPGVHATFAKNAIGAVLEDAEYDRIVNGHLAEDSLDALDEDDLPTVPDSPEGLERIDLRKPAGPADGTDADDEGAGDAVAEAEAEDEPPAAKQAGRTRKAKGAKDDDEDGDGPAAQ